MLTAAVVLFGCVDDGRVHRPAVPGDAVSPLPPGADTGATDSAVEPEVDPPDDCAPYPTGPFDTTSWRIETTEDFDFDALGLLVYATAGELMGATYQGERSVIVPGVRDTRGIQTLSDGNIAIAYVEDGRIGITDRATGGTATVMTGLNMPNALDVGAGDLLYFTELGQGGHRGGTVSTLDLATSERTVIAEGFTYPNGLVVDVGEDTVYVSDYTKGVYRIRRDGDAWTAPERLFEPANRHDTYDALEIDACDNLYYLGFASGRLYRYDPDTGESVLLVDFAERSVLWNAMHWGSDRGGWRRDTLYLTDRHEIFGVSLGVRGEDQPVDLAP